MPPQQLRFLLQTAHGFSPPPAVVSLKDTVDLDLVQGTQFLWTAIMKRKAVSYAPLHDWLALSVPKKKPHRFMGSSFGEDSELSGDISSTLAKVVGLAFITQYAGACWFKVLRPLWGKNLTTTAGDVSVAKKKKGKFGPDYLAAPFDPANAAAGGPFYALELKGKEAEIEFASKGFKRWQAQAINISLRTVPGAAPVNLKSWVLAFNYGFEKPEGAREVSTLLVDDPLIERDAPQLEPNRVNGSSIIRDHLARQCIILGTPALAPYVRLGEIPDDSLLLPPVYSIDHPQLVGRRYIGHWMVRTSTGELLPQPAQRWGSGWTIIEHAPHFIVAHDHRRLVEVHLHGGGPADARAWLNSLMGGDAIFVGQDATMLRRCTQVPVGAPIDGEAFKHELHFVNAGEDAPKKETLRVLRNGSVVAHNVLVELDERPFWMERG